MITYDKIGGRTVELFIPFEFGDRKVEAVTFQPVRFDDTLSFREGKYKTILSLMAKLSGLEEDALRQVRYPDIERVMAVFVDMLPPEIRESINSPPSYENPQGEFPAEEQQTAGPVTNGHDQPLPANEPSFVPTPDSKDPTGLGIDFDGTAN